MSHKPTPPACTTRHAVILAAGESKRTRPLTLHRPKPLIPLLDRPLLAHILDELVGLAERVTLVVGYRAADIEAHFGASYRGIDLRYVWQRAVNGTASALMAVAGQVDEPFFLLYGDNLVSQVDLLAVAGQRYCLAALRVADPRAFGVLEIQAGRVTRILEKPADPPPDALANPGIYHLDPAVFPALERIQPSPRGEYELTDLIGVLAEEHPVGYTVCTGHWVPVGTPWEALSASAFLLARRAGLRSTTDPAAALGPGYESHGPVWIGAAQIGAGCRIVGPAWIGDGAVIGAGCVIEQTVVGDGAHIGDGVVVVRSALGAGVRVGGGALVQSSLLDTGAGVGDGARLPEQLCADVQPVADTAGLLDCDDLRRRGAVLGAGVHLPAGAAVEPGSVIFP